MSKAAELANLIGNINMGGGGVNRNLIINGAMNIAQRSTSETGVGASAGYFTCDRWRITLGGDASAGRFTMSQDSSAPNGFTNSLKIDCTTDDTSIAASERLMLLQRIEGQNLQAFAKGTADAKPFAVSFYVKGNASATYVCELFDVDNTRQCSKTFNVTTDWTRVELTFPADTTGAFNHDNDDSLHLNIFLHSGSTYNSGTLNSSGFASSTNANRAVGISSFFDSTDRTFFITGVQLEVGQNPTEFEHEPVERILAKCQRYTYRINGNTSDDTMIGAGYHKTTTSFRAIVHFPVTMVGHPVVTTNDDDLILLRDTTSDASVTLGSSLDESEVSCGLNIDGVTSTSVGEAGILRLDDTATAFIQFDAEI